ncbi:MAG: hypothetical protein ACRDTA_09220 [Pseudonocardiaceae bacterium]
MVERPVLARDRDRVLIELGSFAPGIELIQTDLTWPILVLGVKQ